MPPHHRSFEIQCVAQPVAEQVDAEHDQPELQRREDDEPPEPENRYWLPMRISVPSEGCVIGMPTPRKESVASDRMARPRLSVAATMTGVSVLGRICRRMIRDDATLMMRAASTYSLRRSTMVEARTVRAYCTQLVSEIETTSTSCRERLAQLAGGSSWREDRAQRIAISSVGIEQHGVAEPHQQIVDPAAMEAGCQADRDADRHRRR